MTVRALLVFLSVAGLSGAASALGAVSKPDLLGLHAAGFSNDAILAQVKREGLAEPLSTKDLLDLRQAGLPASLLEELMRLSAAPAQAAPDALELARSYYRVRDFERMEAVLGDRLAASPEDVKARGLLAAALIAQKRHEAAQVQYERLRALSLGPEDAAAVDRLGRVLEGVRRSRELATQFKLKVAANRPDEALAVIGELATSGSTKRLLEIYVLLYQGRFEAAAAVVAGMPEKSAASAGPKAKLTELVAARRVQFEEGVKRLDWYLYDPQWTFAYWSGEAVRANPESDHFSIEEYVRVASELARDFPLHDRVMDLSFHAGLLGLPYEQLELLGDGVLARKGAIAIPFRSGNAFYEVVIDRNARRIGTRKVESPDFRILKACGACWVLNRECWKKITSCMKIGPGTLRGVGAYSPFSIALDEVSRISQNADPHTSDEPYTRLEGDAYALRIEAGGKVGEAHQYGLMEYIQLLHDTVAQRTVTQNLGKYVLHVINRPEVTAKLADPGKTYWGGILLAAAGGLSSAVAMAPDLASVDLTMALQVANRAAMDAAGSQSQATQAQMAAWQARVDAFAAEIDLVSGTEDLDALLANLGLS